MVSSYVLAGRTTPRRGSSTNHYYEIAEEVVKMAEVVMPMNGKLIDIKVQVGQSVQEDDEVAIIEAMKMELPVVATGSGTVKEIRVTVGESYQVGDVLVVIG